MATRFHLPDGTATDIVALTLWVNVDGAKQFVRYRWEPEAGEETITKRRRARDRKYLQDELRQRLARGPAAFALHLELAEDGDNPDDPTMPWPDDREVVVAGRLEITQVIADQQADCESLIFDPTRVTDGIECSNDPILHARPGAYSVSYDRRTSD